MAYGGSFKLLLLPPRIMIRANSLASVVYRTRKFTLFPLPLPCPHHSSSLSIIIIKYESRRNRTFLAN